MDEKPTPFQRLQKVSEVFRTLDSSASHPAAFNDARGRYCQTISALFPGSSSIPILLKNPAIFFYMRRGKLYFAFPPLSSTAPKPRVVTPESLSDYLTDAAEAPLPDGLCRALCQALYQYLTDYPRDTMEKIIDQIRPKQPGFAAFLDVERFSKLFYVDSRNNLFFDTAAWSPAHLEERRASRYQPVLPLLLRLSDYTDARLPYIPQRILRQYFRQIIQDRKTLKLETVRLPEPSLSVIQRLGTLHTIRYDRASGIFLQCFVPQKERVLLETKGIRSNLLPDPAPAPAAVAAWCRGFFGREPGMMDRFALCLSGLVSMSEHGLTVFYAPQNKETLQQMLQGTFLDSSVSLPRSATLNGVLKQAQMQALYTGQAELRSVVFLRDLLPSEQNLPRLRRIFGGKTLSVKSGILPLQKYQNRLSFVCVTDSWSRAAALKKQLRARVIDLSAAEAEPVPPGTLDKEDLLWFRTAFLLYGLKLRTLADAPEDRPNPDTAALPKAQAEEMEQFWAACCMLRPGVFSSTEEVFACYQRFLAASASSGGLTKIRFNKEFRKWLELRGLRAVTYTRRHCSRQQTSLWGYRGLALTPPPPSSAPAVPPPPCPQDPISTRLEEISRYRIQSDGSLEVRVREIPVPEP